MKSFIVLALFVAAAVAAPAGPAGSEADAVVIRSNLDNIGVEGYKSDYETSNGISGQAEGTLKTIGDSSAVVTRGAFSYTGNDGVVYTVTYIADENGFQPQGAHLPQN